MGIKNTPERGVTVKGDWVPWEKCTINEIRAQIATGALTEDMIWKLMRGHKFNNEVTGWLYKYLHPLTDKHGRVQWNGTKNPYVFDTEDSS